MDEAVHGWGVIRPSLVDEPRWGFPDAIAGYLIGFLAGSALSLTVATITGDTQDLAVVFAGAIGLWVGFLGAPLFATRYRGRRSLRVDFGFTQRRIDPLIGIPAGVLTQLVAIPLLYLPLERIWDVDDLDAPARELTQRATGGARIALIAVVVVGAPVIEELFFRGLLLRAGIRRFGRTAGVLLATTIFAGTHFQLLQFPGLFAAGLTFALLAVATGRLGPAIWAHAAFNATSVAVLMWT